MAATLYLHPVPSPRLKTASPQYLSIGEKWAAVYAVTCSAAPSPPERVKVGQWWTFGPAVYNQHTLTQTHGESLVDMAHTPYVKRRQLYWWGSVNTEMQKGRKICSKRLKLILQTKFSSLTIGGSCFLSASQSDIHLCLYFVSFKKNLCELWKMLFPMTKARLQQVNKHILVENNHSHASSPSLKFRCDYANPDNCTWERRGRWELADDASGWSRTWAGPAVKTRIWWVRVLRRVSYQDNHLFGFFPPCTRRPGSCCSVASKQWKW